MGKFSHGIRTVPIPVYGCALFVLAASILGSVFIFHRTPHINDEFGYIFQAKLFASGHLYAPSPCFKEAFDFPHIINNGKWYSQYPPGFPALLIPFVIAGIPWLINPLFASLSVFVLYFLGLELFGRREGLLTALLGASSIWLVVMSSTMMSHTTNMFFFALFMLFFFRSLRLPSFSNGLIAGASLGMSVIIHPYETVLAALPFLIYYAAKLFKEFRLRIWNAAGLAAAGLFFGGLFMLYNYLTNGAPFLMGHVIRYGPEHGLGFGRTGYTDIPHTPGKGMILIAENLKAINDFLFGWPISSLFFLVPFAIWPGSLKKKTPVLLCLLSFLILSAGLFIYWGTFVLIGARMFFVMLPALVLLSAEGIYLVMEHLPSRTRSFTGHATPKMIMAGVLVVFTLYAFLFKLPKECGRNASGKLVDVHLSFAAAGFSKAMERSVPAGAVVVAHFMHTQLKEFPSGGWGACFLLNDPMLKGRVIYAREMGPADQKFAECFPGRNLYLYWGTLEKGCLVPIEFKGDKKICGRPVRGDGLEPRLSPGPENVFSLYSEGFHDFLKRFFQSHNFADLAAKDLGQMGEKAIQTGDIQAGAYLLEAALQVESESSSRYRMLGKLASAYRRLGEISDSEIILERLNSRKDFDVYNVIPRKGF